MLALTLHWHLAGGCERGEGEKTGGRGESEAEEHDEYS